MVVVEVVLAAVAVVGSSNICSNNVVVRMEMAGGYLEPLRSVFGSRHHD